MRTPQRVHLAIDFLFKLIHFFFSLLFEFLEIGNLSVRENRKSKKEQYAKCVFHCFLSVIEDNEVSCK